MAVTATPVFHQAINVGIETIVEGDGTTAQTIFTAGSNGSKLEMILATSTDTSNRDVYVYLVRSATSYLLCTVQVPLRAGHINNVASLDVLRSGMLPGLCYDALGNRYLNLKSGDTITVALTTGTVTTAKTLTFIAQGSDL